MKKPINATPNETQNAIFCFLYELYDLSVNSTWTRKNPKTANVLATHRRKKFEYVLYRFDKLVQSNLKR